MRGALSFKLRPYGPVEFERGVILDAGNEISAS
jgi:hypothetical protein